VTTKRQRRCLHCFDVYVYTPSTYGEEFPKFNHGSYCPVCWEVVETALKAVPRKRERTWVEVTDVSFERLLEWEARRAVEPQPLQTGTGKTLNVVVGRPRRVFSPLFDLETGAHTIIRAVKGADAFAGRTFRYTRWSDDREPVKIEEEVERDLATGETRPWKNYPRR